MNNLPTVRVWDPLVRIFHWSLVISFAVAYFTSEEENPWHIYAGYTVLGLIVFRLLWGFVGSKHARFVDFVHSPQTVWQYAQNVLSGRPSHYLGHNPLGGWMVVALLATLFVVTLSGLKVYAIEEGKGPFAYAETHELTPIAAAHAEDDDDDDEENKQRDNDENEADEEFWEEIHEASTNLMLLLIGMHVFGIVLTSRADKESLVKAMFTGNKRRRS